MLRLLPTPYDVSLMKYASSLALLFSLMFAPTAALAQETVPILEGSAYAQPPVSVSGEMPPQAAATNPAQMELRISGVEDEMRSLRGKNEELEFRIRKLTENMEKLQRDLEMRLTDLESGKKSSATAAPAEEHKPDAALAPPAAEKPAEPAQPTSGGDGVLRAPDEGAEMTPRGMYNRAFSLLNQTKYDEAARAFDTFIKKYPKDPLVGNAYYWMGETYYIRRDYVASADSFRAGFEALPNGPKAPDNLLKLALSLNALKRDKEACVVLEQVSAKYKKTAAKIGEKAEKEAKRVGCK